MELGKKILKFQRQLINILLVHFFIYNKSYNIYIYIYIYIYIFEASVPYSIMNEYYNIVKIHVYVMCVFIYLFCRYLYS